MSDPVATPLLGCAFLQDAGGLAGKGTACLPGGTPFGFAQVAQLHEKHPEALWVLSASWARFTREAGLRTPWLRSGEFFPTPVVSLAEELGHCASEPEGAARACAEVMNRCLRLAGSQAHLRGAALRLAEANTFTEALRPALRPRPPTASGAFGIDEILSQALQPPVPAGGQANGHDLLVRLTLQRVAHMQTVLDHHAPTGEWREVEMRRVADPFEFATNSVPPVLALVSISKPLPVLSGLMNKRAIRGGRVWMARPELAVIGRFGEPRIERLFVSEGGLPVRALLPITAPDIDAVDHASLASGLLAESFLHCACTPLGHNTGALALATWVTSNARVITFTESAKLVANGFKVLGYGVSHVLVGLHRSRLPELRAYLARSPALLLPARYGAHGERE